MPGWGGGEEVGGVCVLAWRELQVTRLIQAANMPLLGFPERRKKEKSRRLSAPASKDSFFVAYCTVQAPGFGIRRETFGHWEGAPLWQCCFISLATSELDSGVWNICI